ncbi:MAG TPA: hypothetical protein VN370_11205 [Desulfitobacteriaceae bacterium]|nr:hypothetical protein [Desulfitobacteriaceae bacterium]
MSTTDFIEYVCEQISGTDAVRYKKMFDEFMVYVNDKPILLVWSPLFQFQSPRRNGMPDLMFML